VPAKSSCNSNRCVSCPASSACHKINSSPAALTLRKPADGESSHPAPTPISTPNDGRTGCCWNTWQGTPDSPADAPGVLNEHPAQHIGPAIRDLRMQAGISQGEIQKCTGLFRSYLSRVEHGRTVPTLETLYKIAQAFEIPIARFFTYGCAHRPDLCSLQKQQNQQTERAEQDSLYEASRFLAKLNARERRLLLTLIHDLNKPTAISG